MKKSIAILSCILVLVGVGVVEAAPVTINLDLSSHGDYNYHNTVVTTDGPNTTTTNTYTSIGPDSPYLENRYITFENIVTFTESHTDIDVYSGYEDHSDAVYSRYEENTKIGYRRGLVWKSLLTQYTPEMYSDNDDISGMNFHVYKTGWSEEMRWYMSAQVQEYVPWNSNMFWNYGFDIQYSTSDLELFSLTGSSATAITSERNIDMLNRLIHLEQQGYVEFNEWAYLYDMANNQVVESSSIRGTANIVSVHEHLTPIPPTILLFGTGLVFLGILKGKKKD